MALIPRDATPEPRSPPPPPPPLPPIVDVDKIRCANCYRWLCRIAFAADGRWWAIDVAHRNSKRDNRDRGPALWHVVQVEQVAMRCNHCSYVNDVPPQRLPPPTNAL